MSYSPSNNAQDNNLAAVQIRMQNGEKKENLAQVCRIC